MSKEYLENLIKRNDYEKDNQNYLKIRVLKTFENLIKTFFNRNIYDLKFFRSWFSRWFFC